MDIDLLFTVIEPSAFKSATTSGDFYPESFDEKGYIRCFEGGQAEEIINNKYSSEEKLLLIVIDPLRIQDPIKKSKEDGLSFVDVQGAFSIDSIIDKIKLEKDNKGKFNLRIKHFD